MMGFSHIYMIIKSDVGVDFDVPNSVPLQGTSKSTPTLFFIIETLEGTKFGTLIYDVHLSWL